jgi:hypothetical protein
MPIPVNARLNATVDRNRQLQQQMMMQQAAARQAMLSRLAQAQSGGGNRGIQVSPIQKRQSPQPVASGGASTGPSGGGGGAGANPYQSAMDQATTLYKPPSAQSEGSSGIMGALQSVLGNTIVKGALNMIDVPRRLVTSAVKETGDIFAGGASWDDFTEQAADTDFGVGTFLHTGNTWLDRGIGFVGDVALDPTTYILPGASEFAGIGGRAALAGEGALKGLSEEAVGKIARLGESGIEAVERQAGGAFEELGKTGYRFGTAKHNVRIPGTGRLQEGVQKATTAARTSLSDTGLASTWRRLRTDTEMLPFVERLATGKGEGTAIDAANAIAGLKAARGASGGFLGAFQSGVTQAAKDFAGRTDLTHELESGARSAEGKLLVGIKDAMYSEAKGKGVAALAYRQQHVPHYNTDDFETFLGRARDNDAFARKGKAPAQGSGRLEQRVFQPNTDYTINGVDIHLDRADIADITDKFQKAFPTELGGKKLIEDDPSVWLPRLLEDHAADVGQASWEQRLKSGGSLVDAADVMDKVPDKAATKEAQDVLIGRAKNDIKARRKQRTELTEAIRTKVNDAVKASKKTANDELGKQKVRGKVADEYLGRVSKDQKVLGEQMAGQAAKVGKEGADLRKKWAQAQRAFEAADDEVTRAQKAWHTSEDPTQAIAYQRALDQRKQLVEEIKAGLSAEPQADILRGQLSDRFGVGADGIPEAGTRTFVGATEGPPTAVPRSVAEGTAGLQEGLLGRTGQREANRVFVADSLGEVTPNDRFTQQLASLAEGRPVSTRAEAEDIIARTKGKKLGDMRKAAEKAIGPDAETGRGKAGLRYGDKERKAAKRELSPEELADPTTLADDVLAVSPRAAEQWQQGQAELNELLKPYRTSDVEGAAGRNVTEAEAQTARLDRTEVEDEIKDLTRKIEKMRVGNTLVPTPGGGSRSVPMRNSPEFKQLQRDREALQKRLADLKQASPVSASAEAARTKYHAAVMRNPKIAAKVRDQQDLAEFMARKYRAVADGHADTLALDRQVVDTVLSKRKADLVEKGKTVKEATGKLELATDRGKNVPRWTEDEVQAQLNKKWDAFRAQHERSYANWERFEREHVQAAHQMMGNGPPVPRIEHPDLPTIHGADREFKAAVEPDGMATFTTADGENFHVETPEEWLSLSKADYENKANDYERVMSDYEQKLRSWRKEREAATDRAAAAARKSGQRVPKKPPSKATFMDHHGRLLRDEKRYVPSMSEEAATKQVDIAMSGRFRELVSAFAEDVTAARKGKNQLDAAAKKAGHSLPKTQSFVSNEKIDQLVPALREFYDEVGDTPEFYNAVSRAAETLQLSKSEKAALAQQMGRDTGGKFVPLEEWQRAKPVAETAAQSSKRAESKRALREQLGIQGEDSLGLALTDLRTTARQQVNETEWQFMRDIEGLTGVKWDQPRKAITRTKGGRSTKWMLGGNDAEVDQIRRHIIGQSGMSPGELAQVQAPDRMLRKWAADAYEKKFPWVEGMGDDETVEWYAHMASKEEAINKMTEKKLVAFMKDELGIDTGLEHVKVNKKLTDAEAQAAYLNGMADSAYRYIDQGQAERIQELYGSMSKDAKASLYNHVAGEGRQLNRELTDVEVRLGNIDAKGGGAAATHDPLDMLFGSRTGGQLEPSSIAGRQAELIRPFAKDAMGDVADAANAGVDRVFHDEDITRLMQEQAVMEQRAPNVAAREAEDVQLGELAQAREDMPVGPRSVVRQQTGGIDQAEQQLLEQRAARQATTDTEDAARAAERAQIDATLDTLSKRTGIAETELAKLLNLPTARPAAGTRDLSDLAPRATARADVKALDTAEAGSEAFRQQYIEDQARRMNANQGLGQQAEDVARTGSGVEEMIRFGPEQQASDDLVRNALQGQLDELTPTIERGRAARSELGGRSVSDIAEEEYGTLRNQPGQVGQGRKRATTPSSQEDMNRVVAQKAAAQREVDSVTQAMTSMSEENRKALGGFHDSQLILAGHEDAALAHSYQADDLIKQAKANVEHFKAAAPKRVSSVKADAVAQSYMDWINDTEKFLGAADMPAEAKALMTAALNDATGRVMPNGKRIGGFQDIDRKIAGGEAFIKSVKDGKVVEMFKDQMRSGYVAYKSKIGTGTGADMAMHADLDRMMRNMGEAFSEPGKLGQALDAYTKFFKAYATATPGFHLRNAMSAVFMNSAAGVSLENQMAGTKIWAAHMRNPSGEWWLDPKIAKWKDQAQDVVKAVYNSGAGGQFSAAEIGRRAFGEPGSKVGNLVQRNRLIRGSQKLGERIEGSVRAGMALDSLSRPGIAGRSGSIATASERINRIHFNYSETSKLDAQLRRVIPFWTFISRNVPLQAQMMFTNPRAYNHYSSFKRNFRDQNADDSLLPEWMQEAGGFSLPGGLGVAMPDIGATQLQAQLGQLSSPSRLVGMTNPLFKGIAQEVSNHNFFYDSSYGENDLVPVKGGLSLAGPLLSALGMSEDIPGGGQATQRKHADTIKDLFPFLASYDRVTGGSSTGIKGFLGIPVRDYSEEDKAKEAKKRLNQAKADTSGDAARRKALAKLANAS